MSPILHYKSSKRKVLSSVELLRRTQVYQQVADADNPTHVVPYTHSKWSRFPKVQILHNKSTTNHLNKRQQQLSPSNSNSENSQNATSAYLVAAMTEIPITSPSPSPTTLTLTTTTTTTTATTTTTTTPPTAQFQGQDPLSSVAVQAILGIIGALLIGVLVLRCFCLRRQSHAMKRARELQVMASQGVSVENAVPTSEMTLAGRLQTYQLAADANRYIYPPHGHRQHASEEGREGGVASNESISSFIAPAYNNDVSPPPFVAGAGKPPAYADVVVVV